MDIISAILIGLGVLLGIIMAIYGFQQKHIPKGLAIIHGSLTGVGIILLIIYALTTKEHHKHWDNIGIFLFTAIVGIWLLLNDLKKKYANRWLILIHGLLGLGAIAYFTMHLLH